MIDTQRVLDYYNNDQEQELIEYLESLNNPKLELYAYYDSLGMRTQDTSKAKTALFNVL